MFHLTTPTTNGSLDTLQDVGDATASRGVPAALPRTDRQGVMIGRIDGMTESGEPLVVLPGNHEKPCSEHDHWFPSARVISVSTSPSP